MKNKYYPIPYDINDLCDLFNKAVKMYGNKIYAEQFVNDEIKKYSFFDLNRDVGIMCNYLKNNNLSNTNILISGDLSYEWIVTFFAVIFVSSKAVCIDRNILERNDYPQVINGIDISCIISDSQLENTKSLNFNDIRDILNKNYSNSTFDFSINIKNASETVAVILFTSGTTNIEKQVQLTHKNLADDIMGCQLLVGVHSYDRMLSFLPIHHAFELTVGVFITLYIGMTVCIPRGLRYAMKDINSFSPTLIPVVPLIMQTIMKNIKAEIKRQNKENSFKILLKAESIPFLGVLFRKKLYNSIVSSLGGNLKIFVCGGAAADNDMLIFFKKIGFRVCMGYGITECSPVICCGDKKVGSVGPPMPFCEIKVINDELCVRGSIVAKQLGPKVNDHMEFYGDWYKTGDIGYIDKKGNVFITGRKKELIILDNGENVSPTQLENILNNIEGVDQTIAFAYSMSNKTKAIAVAIKPIKEWEHISCQELIDNYRKQINSLKLPNHLKIEKLIIFREDFIYTSSKKIKRDDTIKLIEDRCKVYE